MESISSSLVRSRGMLGDFRRRFLLGGVESLFVAPVVLKTVRWRLLSSSPEGGRERPRVGATVAPLVGVVRYEVL